MRKLYAQMTANSPNEIVLQVDPIQYGDAMYYGCKRVFLKKETKKDRTIQVADDSKPVEYDNITQQLIDINVNKNSSANIIGELAQNKMLNANLINQLAQQKQVNLDQKNINAQLIAQLAKNGGNKNV